jgi:hypothetical protein
MFRMFPMGTPEVILCADVSERLKPHLFKT